MRNSTKLTQEQVSDYLLAMMKHSILETRPFLLSIPTEEVEVEDAVEKIMPMIEFCAKFNAKLMFQDEPGEEYSPEDIMELEGIFFQSFDINTEELGEDEKKYLQSLAEETMRKMMEEAGGGGEHLWATVEAGIKTAEENGVSLFHPLALQSGWYESFREKWHTRELYLADKKREALSKGPETFALLVKCHEELADRIYGK